MIRKHCSRKPSASAEWPDGLFRPARPVCTGRGRDTGGIDCSRCGRIRVGQIARIRGCRTVGIAGGAEKVRQCVEEFGYDSAIDYKNTSDLNGEIEKASPDGVDMYFDNTCGPISDSVLGHLATDCNLRYGQHSGMGPVAGRSPRSSSAFGRPRANERRRFTTMRTVSTKP